MCNKTKNLQKKFQFLWISQEFYIHLPMWKSSAYSGRQQHLFSHCYDADSERMVKTSGEHEAIYVNYRASQTYMWTESKSSIKKIMIYIGNISKYK